MGLLHVLILYQEILNRMSHVATLLAISSCVARHPETFTWPAHICSETKHLSHGPWEHRLRLLLSRHVVTQLLLMLWGAWSITNLAGQPLLEQGRALKVSSPLCLSWGVVWPSKVLVFLNLPVQSYTRSVPSALGVCPYFISDMPSNGQLSSDRLFDLDFDETDSTSRRRPATSPTVPSPCCNIAFFLLPLNWDVLPKICYSLIISPGMCSKDAGPLENLPSIYFKIHLKRSLLKPAEIGLRRKRIVVFAREHLHCLSPSHFKSKEVFCWIFCIYYQSPSPL